MSSGDDEGLIALLVCEGTQGATRLVCDGDDALASFFASYLLFEERLEERKAIAGSVVVPLLEILIRPKRLSRRKATSSLR